MTALKEKREQEILDYWTDLYLSQSKRSGFISVTDLEKQTFYNSDEAAKLISDTAGKKDLYISLNAFGYNSNRVLTRKSEQLKQIRNIGIDIDQYKLNLSIDEAIDMIQVLILENKIPEPNMVLTSRGIQLFYSVAYGAAPTLDWLAGYITEQMIGKLEEVGADYQAAGMSRVMRVPGTINTRNNTTVKYDIWDNVAYSLQQLQAYCAPLEDRYNKRNKRDNTSSLPGVNVARVHRTNWARKQDLKKLFELRNGNFTGCRNTFIYIAAFQQTLIFQDSYEKVSNSVRKTTQGIYSTDPAAEKIEHWFDSTVKSAFEDGIKFMNYLKENNYRILYNKNDGVVKPYKTENILKKLSIKEHEQRQMRTFKNNDIRREHHADYMAGQRRKQGVKPMADYNTSRHNKKIEDAQQVAALQAQGFKQKDIAEKLNISTKTVRRLIKFYKECLTHE